MVEPRLALDQLERARLVVARQHARSALGQPELEPPALGRLRDVGDAQADVVQAPDHRLTRTGRRLIPLKKFERSRSGGAVSSMSVVRDSSSSKAIRTSIFARCAPMQ